ncbi:MAG TPA: hypothetical protein VGY91_13845 [Chthoniobacterales bacterium]|jgi:hypothetical protein|nr:hypothetical protein [Chthoniobacterales bacterium]
MFRFTLHHLLSTALFALIYQVEPAALNAAESTSPLLKDSASILSQVITGRAKAEETQKQFEGGLVSKLKKQDPFQLPIRGKYRGANESGNGPASQPEAAKAPATTFAQAIEHLPVRGVDLASREVLIGSRSLNEGDLLALEFNNQQFAAWVRSVGKEGVTFINAQLTETAQRPVSSGPRDPDEMDQSRPDLPSFGQRSSESALVPVSTSSGRPSAYAANGGLEIDRPDVYRVQDFPINELFEFLARKAGLQYFFNPAVDKVRVTGEFARRANLMDSMQELALQYNLSVYQRGRTIYLITSEQNF